MVSRRLPNPVETANPAPIPVLHSPLGNTPHNAEDFKQGAQPTELAAYHATDGTLLKIPLC
jgi:hypothetical protein